MVDRLQRKRAIPSHWFDLPDVPSSPSELSIKFPLRAPNSLRSRGMHPIIAEYRDVVPLVESQWSLPPAYTGWSSAWRAVQAVRLPSPYTRDTAFRYLFTGFFYSRLIECFVWALPRKPHVPSADMAVQRLSTFLIVALVLDRFEFHCGAFSPLCTVRIYPLVSSSILYLSFTVCS